MEDAITLTIDSTYNAEDCYGSIESAIDYHKGAAAEFGVDLFDFKVLDDEEIITASVQFPSLSAVKAWLKAESPELSDEDILDILEEAGI